MNTPSQIYKIGTADYINVSRGIYSGGAARFQGIGYSTGIGTSESTVWNQSTTNVVYPASAAVVEISSSSANDTAAGTGARKVVITGLDANYNQITETVTLNGQTAVNSTLSYLRINRLQVDTAGSGGVNAGVIYAGTGSVSVGVPATIYNSIAAGLNRSASAFFTVPANVTAYLTRLAFSSDQGGGTGIVTLRLFVRPPSTYTGTGPNLFFVSRILVGQGQTGDTYTLPPAYGAGTDLELRAAVSTGTAKVAVEGELLLMNPQ